ncbi:hypothetical protein L917_19935, partial [Phytophthora nicotianae]
PASLSFFGVCRGVMMIHPDEAAFLSEISELLGDFETPTAAEAIRHVPTAVASPAGLLSASHQLVAETEALLSSCSTPSSEENKTSRNQTLAERRKIRNANAAKRRLKYCKKIENERELLKQQAKELAGELVELQAKQSERHVVTPSMPVWQAVAIRQLQSRLKAEAERRRLREIVATRTKLLRELGEKVQQHLQGAHQEDRTGEGTPLTAEDKTLFEKYLQDMDVAYSQVGSILTAWGVLNTSLASFHPDPKRLNDGNAEYYESLGVQLTPFNSQQTGTALWQSMRLRHQQKCRLQYRGVSDPENMLAVKFRVEDSDKPASLVIRIVLRKWVEDEQAVILWRAHTQGEGELSHFHADETGWSVVRPTDVKTHKELGMPTAILTFIRFIPHGEAAGAREDTANIEQFLQLAETSGNEDGSEIVRMMESLLLDDARSTQSCCYSGRPNS